MFSEVYGNKARVVVVLYRKEWGETPWTRVEASAIRNRSLSDSWDFTVFIPTEDRPSMPPWVPKTRLYVGLQRFGIESAAGVIEQRVSERGGEPKVETVIERAARHARANELRQMQRQFIKSDIGVKAATAAFEEYSTAIEDACEAVKKAGAHLQPRRWQNYRIVSTGAVNLITS